MVGAIALLAVAALVAPARASHLVVRADGTGDVATLQAGIDCVLGLSCDPSPDTLLVEPGVYAEDVFFDMSSPSHGAQVVAAAGPDSTRVRSVASGGGFNARCTLTGLQLDGAIHGSDSGSVLHWQGCRFMGEAFSHGFIGDQSFADCEFRGRTSVAGAGELDRCRFVGARAALELTIFGLSIRDCVFESCADTAVLARPGDASYLEFQRCVFRSVDRAIVVDPNAIYNRDGLQVSDCRFEDVAHEAISYDALATFPNSWIQFAVLHSSFRRCGAGLRVTGDSRIDLAMVGDTLEDTKSVAVSGSGRLNWSLDSLVVRRGGAAAVAFSERTPSANQYATLPRFFTRSIIEDNAGQALAIDAEPDDSSPHRWIAENVLRRNGAGIRVPDRSTVIDNVIAGNGGDGLRLTSSLATDDSLVRNTLTGNAGSGLVVSGPDTGAKPVVFVENNLATENLLAGIARQGLVAGSASGNDAWRNHVADFQGVDPMQNLIANPLYCDPNGFDYRVAANSSCAPNGPHGQIGALGVGCDPQVVSVDPRLRTALAIGRVAPNPLVGGSEVTVSFTLPARSPRPWTCSTPEVGGWRPTRGSPPGSGIITFS